MAESKDVSFIKNRKTVQKAQVEENFPRWRNVNAKAIPPQGSNRPQYVVDRLRGRNVII